MNDQGLSVTVALTYEGIEDFLCEGDCKNPGMCNGTDVTWCGRKAEAILKAIGDPAQQMQWQSAEGAQIDDSAYYVVQHNGHEWRDFDLAVLRGSLVRRRLEPDY